MCIRSIWPSPMVHAHRINIKPTVNFYGTGWYGGLVAGLTFRCKRLIIFSVRICLPESFAAVKWRFCLQNSAPSLSCFIAINITEQKPATFLARYRHGYAQVGPFYADSMRLATFELTNVLQCGWCRVNAFVGRGDIRHCWRSCSSCRLTCRRWLRIHIETASQPQ